MRDLQCPARQDRSCGDIVRSDVGTQGKIALVQADLPKRQRENPSVPVPLSRIPVRELTWSGAPPPAESYPRGLPAFLATDQPARAEPAAGSLRIARQWPIHWWVVRIPVE